MNIVSRLLTILYGMSYNLNMFFMNAFATVVVVYGYVIGMKLLYLLNLSTIIMITLYPLDKGNPFMKSILISTHTLLGIGRGCKAPAGLRFFVLFLWHTSHSLMNFLMSFLKSCQKNSLLSLE